MTTKRKPGRPDGTPNPSTAERMRRRLSRIYEAQARAAENGSTEAARFCVDLVRNPQNFPEVSGRSKAP